MSHGNTKREDVDREKHKEIKPEVTERRINESRKERRGIVCLL
jgi:hypothetical protein